MNWRGRGMHNLLRNLHSNKAYYFSTDEVFEIIPLRNALVAKTTTWNNSVAEDAKLGDMSHHKKTYVNPLHTKKIFANMKREGKDFSGRVTPLFATMMVQANQEDGADSATPTDSHSTPIITQPKETNPKENAATPSCNPPQSGEDRMKLIELMNLCTQLQEESQEQSGFKRLRKVRSASRVESSNDVSLGAQEDASKQGRKIADLDTDAEILRL
ncbi:hypothetical protein Tco_0887996 [Tanacetum coccineum]